MSAFVVSGLFFLSFVGLGIGGHLKRIADAIEAQNRAYGVAEKPTDSEEIA